MAIKLPKDIIEAGYRFEACIPKPVIETEKKPDGSFSIYAGYDESFIDRFVKDMARDMNEKLSAKLIDELLRLNGYVPERTCRRIVHGLERNREIATVSWTCSKCGKHIGRDDSFCPKCGARVEEEA